VALCQQHLGYTVFIAASEYLHLRVLHLFEQADLNFTAIREYFVADLSALTILL